jgi:ketosteroid isomerase-like protein
MITRQLPMQEIRCTNVELVRRFIEAINDSWNVAAMERLVSEDFLFEIPFAPEWFRVRCEGKGSALAFLDSVRNIMEPENLHALVLDTCASDPGEVIAQYRSDTRMRSTGLAYRNEYIARFTVRDGKISRFAEYLDPIRYVIAIGGKVDPPPGIAAART